MQNKVLLSWVIQHLSKTAADANGRLCKDYIDAAKKLADSEENSVMPDFIPLPSPLVITGMKMKFSANVSRGDKSLGGDMMLEFGKPANFHGEIELKPYGSNFQNISGYDTDEAGHAEQTDCASHTGRTDNTGHADKHGEDIVYGSAFDGKASYGSGENNS